MTCFTEPDNRSKTQSILSILSVLHFKLEKISVQSFEQFLMRTTQL